MILTVLCRFQSQNLSAGGAGASDAGGAGGAALRSLRRGEMERWMELGHHFAVERVSKLRRVTRFWVFQTHQVVVFLFGGDVNFVFCDVLQKFHILMVSMRRDFYMDSPVWFQEGKAGLYNTVSLLECM